MQARAADHPGCAVAGAPFLPNSRLNCPLRQPRHRLAQDIAAGRAERAGAGRSVP
jgi:hypothetical protein